MGCINRRTKRFFPLLERASDTDRFNIVLFPIQIGLRMCSNASTGELKDFFPFLERASDTDRFNIVPSFPSN
jgi:hypothetical protein